MPRPHRHIPAVSTDVQLDQNLYEECRRRFADPGNKKTGMKHGAISKLVNQLLTKHFNDNPFVTLSQLENPGS